MIKNIYIILFVGFLIRVTLLIIDQFWFRLPQGGVDTENFDIWAYNLYLNGYYSFLETIANGTHMFSSYGAFIYSIFGRSPILWAFTMVLFSIGTIFNIYKITFFITNDYKTANLSALIACFFPNLILLSVFVLREAPIHFFLTLFMLGFVKYLENKRFLNLIIAILAGLICVILHTGMIGVFAGIGFFYLFKLKANIVSKFTIVAIVLIGVYYINLFGIGLSKVGGSLDNVMDVIVRTDNIRGGSQYPQWLFLTGGISDVFLIPIRFIAFLFAPLLPFMAKEGSHFIGLIDAFLYLFMCFYIIKNRKNIRNNKYATAIAMVVLFTVLANSLGASNFGTNIRHRTKILPLIIILYSISKSEKRRHGIYEGK
jgi:4-amino-4-deoxy-L-arabinose transferase-like glycosyltransferase